MKKQIVKSSAISLLTLIAIVTAVGFAQGQSLANKIKASVPFDFSVGDQKFPAGEYWIDRANENSDDSIVLISSVDDHHLTFRLTVPIVTQLAKQKETLIFHRYGSQYFLAEVWAAGADTGRKFFESNREQAARAKNLAEKTSMKEETVVSGPQ